ncbi:Eco57I restriction-modification methylase domain-containing protein [Acinetobacter sp. 3657]|uniref:Eco57I restriction-modification methylase domain-containing protein n=1 Tax=Acinetobacter sp. 3657 TaxID=2817764 RepID=UPI002854C301|nr:hypothetical protein [Prolinoborus sp. 3657]
MNIEAVRNQYKTPKTYYELSASQVSTPEDVVSFFWSLVKQYRTDPLKNIVDFGAGDARFSQSDHFEHYLGIEIDPNAIVSSFSKNTRIKIINDCAFNLKEKNFDACIGNPPYVRHHDIESPWKEKIGKYLEKQLNIKFNLHSNLFSYFIALGLIKTHEAGLIAQVIPYEWVSRPSYNGLRDLLIREKWQVDIYCFEYPVFKDVLTTACITIIDKSKKNSQWNYFNVDKKLNISKRQGVSGTGKEVLAYSKHTTIRARRGISPGSQKIFTLTEGERIHNRISKNDVEPCVTTLKGLPDDLYILDQESFKKYFVSQGRKCWLIKSNQENISKNLKIYLDNIPEYSRQNYTCTHQHPWYNYEKYIIPQILIHSGFTKFGPRVLQNKVGAVAVGSVMAIDSDKNFEVVDLIDYLQNFNFEDQVVAHSNNLKKIEVRQLNSVINKWIESYELKH